jgi:hypothetical protein
LSSQFYWELEFVVFDLRAIEPWSGGDNLAIFFKKRSIYMCFEAHIALFGVKNGIFVLFD